MTKEIKLTQGKFAIVDDEWFDYLNQWEWYAVKNGRTFYAIRNEGKRPNRKTIWMHRVVFNSFVKQQIDHIDGNGLNNTRENLRECSPSENQHNSRIHSNNTSGYKGVCYHKPNRKFVAKIGIDGKRVHIGMFDTAEEAAIAYDNVARKLYGEFSNTNFP